jgi:hypothetical protein
LHHYHSLYDVKEKLQLELCELLAILFELPTNEQGGFGKLQRALTGWGLAKLAVNLHASPFIKDLSNETIFIEIHQDGQYQREMK